MGKAVRILIIDGWCHEFSSQWRQLLFLLIFKPLDVNLVQKRQECQICVVKEKLD